MSDIFLESFILSPIMFARIMLQGRDKGLHRNKNDGKVWRFWRRQFNPWFLFDVIGVAFVRVTRGLDGPDMIPNGLRFIATYVRRFSFSSSKGKVSYFNLF
ncbi:hypothetical protein CEXT_204491 [Caerostris extrusa]|uniref:Uncharacterized protein n=1 Tax=Caerostris extrusa TaxID=172846 RepID=A0AAV4PBL0_CAEEX|nr:hypothetical protein CEXT_204491 [Caerostris extrusa]